MSFRCEMFKGLAPSSAYFWGGLWVVDHHGRNIHRSKSITSQVGQREIKRRGTQFFEGTPPFSQGPPIRPTSSQFWHLRSKSLLNTLAVGLFDIQTIESLKFILIKYCFSHALCLASSKKNIILQFIVHTDYHIEK